MALRLEKVKCPVCGVEFVSPTAHGEVVCPNGHVFNVGDVEENSVLDCEIRDWERFALLPLSMQNAVLEVIQSGRVPKDLLALMRRLRESGIVVCT